MAEIRWNLSDEEWEVEVLDEAPPFEVGIPLLERTVPDDSDLEAVEILA